MLFMLWEFESTKKIRDYVENLEVTDPEFLSNQFKRLIVMGKEYLPAMTTEEAVLLVESLHNVDIPRVGGLLAEDLPKFLGDQVAYKRSPNIAFVQSISSLDPLQAYLLLVAVECFWLHRELKLSEPPDFKFYFNITI